VGSGAFPGNGEARLTRGEASRIENGRQFRKGHKVDVRSAVLPSSPGSADVREIPALPPIMIAEQAQDPAVRERPVVNFVRHGFGSERVVPQQAEQCPVAPIAQPVRALAAHAGGGGGFNDAPRTCEHLDEAKLAFGRPAVPSTSLRTGTADIRIGMLAHRPAWTTDAGL
jgi:hypothetical protein